MMSKRLFDLLIASIAFLALLPLCTFIFLLVLFFQGKPVLFCQRRPGLNNKLFKMYKFRTMQDDLDDFGRPLPDAQRLTRLGAFLRATSLDELPELWNVMKGDMSLVGPRPLLEEYLSKYTQEQLRRHEVRPGVTGWAQINGRNGLSWDEKFKLDVWYVDNRSFFLDLKILALTMIKVLKREGITQDGHATMTKFQGAEK